MKEEWREVYGFDHLYEISNLGKLRTKFAGKRGYTKDYRYIEPRDNGNGYLRFNLKCNGKQRTTYAHRLVAEYFVDNPCGYTEINHIDENKKNNCADNLEWCTHAYNSNYGTKLERAARFSRKKIKCIETGQIYGSLEEASRAMNVVKGSISNCLHGRSKSAAGFTWEFVNV